MMRFDGILTAWNQATGSGVITPGKGGDDIAAYASAFPKDGKAPAIGEALSFEVKPGPDGIKLAHSIARPRAASRVAVMHEQPRSASSLITAALVILTASAALYYASLRQDGRQAVPAAAIAAELAAEEPHEHRTDPVAASRFARPPSASCDGRTRCSQMNSCAEAKFFQQHCAGAAMDGDRDGIPCESQWCTSAEAGMRRGF